jgi:Flp pilus assembly protein TadB
MGKIKFIAACLLLISVLIIQSCNVERYRRDRRNRMSARAKKSQHYLSKQAKEITAKNIKGKDAKFKEAEKRKAKQQEDLNALNRPKNKKVHTGKFIVY